MWKDFFDIVRDSIMNDIILHNDKYEVEHQVQGIWNPEKAEKKGWEKLNKCSQVGVL